jgi:hypothetical protein
MLSDLNDDSNFSFGLGYAYTDSGQSDYHSIALSARYKILDWFQVTGSVPYRIISGEESVTFREEQPPGSGTFVDSIEKLDYDTSGIGDVSLMGWVNLTYFLQGETEALDKSSMDASDIWEKPSIYLGVGVKLPTGEDDETDSDKLAVDQRANLTGEYSQSEGVIPARFQVGTGTTDILFGAVYQQRFGRFIPVAGVTYQLVDDESDAGYEYGDMLSITAGSKYIISEWEGCRQFYVSGGVSASLKMEDDYDHSEDTTRLGSQPKGEVPDTDEDYYFANFAVGYDVTEDLRLVGGFTLPLNDPDDDSPNSFDKSISVGIQYSF